MDRPKFGQEYKGHFFLGGDPSKKSAWATREKFTELQEEFSPTKGMSGTEKFLAGVGSGMVDAGRNVTNMLLPDSMTPKWASDDAINEQRRLDQSLMDTGAGLAGNIVGGAVATAPVGGAALKGVQLAGRGVQAARGGGRLARTLGAGATGRAAQVSAQGAAEGAILGGPDNRMTGAGIGATGAGLMHGTGRLGKTLLNRRAQSIAPNRGMSEEAKALMGLDSIDPRAASLTTRPPLMDVGHIPASQSATEGSLLKQLYGNVVANMPGSSQPLRRQLSAAQHRAREEVIETAIPAGVPRATVIDIGDNIQGTMGRLKNAWSGAWDEVKQMVYAVPDTFKVSSGVEKMLAKEFGSKIKIPVGGDIADGAALIAFRNGIKKLRYGKGSKMTTKAQEALDRVMTQVDDIIKDNLDPNGIALSGSNRLPDGPRIYRDFLHNIEAWKNLQTIKQASKKAPKSEFSFAKLADVAKGKAGDAGFAGQGGRLQEVGETAADVLRDMPSKPNPYATLAAFGIGNIAAAPVLTGAGALLGGSEGASYGAMSTPFAVLGGSRLLTNPTIQRKLLGSGKVGGRIAKRLKKALEARGVRGIPRGQAYGFAGRQLGVAATQPEEF